MRSFARCCCLGVLAVLLSGMNAAYAEADVSPKQAADMQAAKKAIIVDVREDSEWQEQHIPGALHIPLSQLDSRMAELKDYKHSPLIMQCRSGKRSAKAQAVLKAAGFSDVYNLEGGLTAWQEQGLAVQ